jgi:spore maturation protein CgeB
MESTLRFVFLGLSITSSWGTGHATTYRGLVNALVRRGHEVLFLERDVPWYARHRDVTALPGARVALYASYDELKRRFATRIRTADVVIVGSYVPEGEKVGRWVRATAQGLVAFYDIDTPVTLALLESDRCEYLSRQLLRAYDLYLSFSGGPALQRLDRLGARLARPLYCAVDAAQYLPARIPAHWDLGYLGTYAPDRQAALETLLLRVAERSPDGRFVVGGPLYPPDVQWPANVERTEHVPPAEHSRFYGRQRFTLNLTRGDMRRLGYSPSVRLFEAAACGAAILTDDWEGLEDFFTPGLEVVCVRTGRDVMEALHDMSDAERQAFGLAARARVLGAHTSDDRARTLEAYALELLGVREAASPEPRRADGRRRRQAERVRPQAGTGRSATDKDLIA